VNRLPNSLLEYNFDYPESLIAYSPLLGRSDSRLLVVRRNPSAGLPQLEDCNFSELPQIVSENKELAKLLLVRNRSKVFPARLFATRSSGSRHEIVLTERISATTWKALIKNVARIKSNEKLKIEGSLEELEVLAPDTVRFQTHHVHSLLDEVGKVPLPPYIRREAYADDKSRYQSVWAEGEALSSAAPTASLHFTDEMWALLQSKVDTADVFLHVGRGTFEPLRENDLAVAELHEESFQISQANRKKIESASGVFAIGTTACRVVETLSNLENNSLVNFEEFSDELRGKTKIFIRPGYDFKKVHALLTNFHLPQSSLFVLVSVFAQSVTLAKDAYAHAVSKRYRLFSYGDASLWLP
jgi:S-adenosylmethionine:tRNA ribosyltransferase-isomerase